MLKYLLIKSKRFVHLFALFSVQILTPENRNSTGNECLFEHT